MCHARSTKVTVRPWAVLDSEGEIITAPEVFLRPLGLLCLRCGLSSIFGAWDLISPRFSLCLSNKQWLLEGPLTKFTLRIQQVESPLARGVPCLQVNKLRGPKLILSHRLLLFQKKVRIARFGINLQAHGGTGSAPATQAARNLLGDQIKQNTRLAKQKERGKGRGHRGIRWGQMPPELPVAAAHQATGVRPR